MNLSLFAILFLFIAYSVVIIITINFVNANNNNNDPNVIKGRWAVTISNPSQATTVKDVFLSEISQLTGTTRITARFITDDASHPGNFYQDVMESFSTASSCSSAPDPEFWKQYGDKLMLPKAGNVAGNQLSVTLRRLRAVDGSVVLPGGRAQTITCGPVARTNLPLEAERPKVTTRGVRIDPPSFSFVIEPSSDSQIVFLRHPDYMPFSSITYSKSAAGSHQRRSDFDHIEIFANPQLGVNSMDFYVAARGNEFIIDTEEQRQKLREEIANKFICTPAPCHLVLRNRTFNFVDIKEAETFAKKNGFYDSVDVKSDNDKKGLKSWLTGVSEDDSTARNSSDDPHIIRPDDVIVISSALVRVKIHSAELFRRGFDLPPLDDLDALAKSATASLNSGSANTRRNPFLSRSRGANSQDPDAPPPLPAKPSLYKFQLRHLDRAVLRNPDTIHYDHALDRAAFLSMEAPYAPAQRLRLTYVREDRGAYPLESKAGGPLVLTDRCVASGFQFLADERVRGKVMPAFVHRCPASLIVHGDMLAGLHPYGVKIDNMLSVERCRGQKLQCKQTLLEEYPPHFSNNSLSSQWALNRLVEDIPGFVTSQDRTNSVDDAFFNQEGQDVLFPNLQDHLGLGDGKSKKIDVATAKFAYPLAASPVMSQLLDDAESWILDFDFFSKGALRVTFRPTPNFRVKQATVLSFALHPGMLRNGRPSDATDNPMTIVVVPSHGILTPSIIVDAGDNNNNNNNNIPTIDVSSSSLKLTLNVVWRLDEYDEFSQELISKLNENFVGKDILQNSGNDDVLPTTWTAFIPSTNNNNNDKAESTEENSACSEWRVKPGVAESVILQSAATEKEIKLQLTFSLPENYKKSFCPDEIELNAPGVDSEKWIKSGKMPLVETAKFKIA